MHPDLIQIQTAAEGLQMMSESDYPFETFQWSDTSKTIEEKILEETKHPAGTAIEKISLEYFFRNMTRPDGSGDDQQTAQRFIALQQLLNEKLSGVEVYRVGIIQVDAFVIGKLGDGSYAGLRTKLIET
jgi:hypothetical protein